MGAEPLREGADEALFGRGIHDGEGDFLEGPREVDGEGAVEEFGDLMSVIAKGSATPGAENLLVVSIELGDRIVRGDTLAKDCRELG